MKQIPIERREETFPDRYLKVVKCKNCYWWSQRFGTKGRCMLMRDYCSRGERKEETDTPSFMSEWAREIEEQFNSLSIRKDKQK